MSTRTRKALKTNLYPYISLIFCALFFNTSVSLKKNEEYVHVRGFAAGFRPLQALDVFPVFKIETMTMSGGTLAYKMGFGKGLLGVLHRKRRTHVSMSLNIGSG